RRSRARRSGARARSRRPRGAQSRRSAWLETDPQLARVEGLGEGLAALDAAQAHQPAQRLGVEPGLARLRRVGGEQRLHLALGELGVETDVGVGLAEVALVLRDLVLEDQVVAPGVPGQLRDEAVVLVPVAERVGEDQVRVELALQALEAGLDAVPLPREVAVPEREALHALPPA